MFVSVLITIKFIHLTWINVSQVIFHCVDILYLINFSSDFRPTKLSDFSADKFPLPIPKLSVNSSSSSSPSEIPTAATSLGGSAIAIVHSGSTGLPQTKEKMRVDRSPSCVPYFALAEENATAIRAGHSPSRKEQPPSASLSSSPQPGQSSLHVERQIGGYK